MPLLEAMSLAREGEDSLARALSLAAAMAEVVDVDVDVFLGVVASPVVVPGGSASSLDGLSSDVVVVSAMASFSWAVL